MGETNERWYIIYMADAAVLANDGYWSRLYHQHEDRSKQPRVFSTFDKAYRERERIQDEACPLDIVNGNTFDAIVTMEKARRAVDDA